MNPSIAKWAIRNGVGMAALKELQEIFELRMPAPFVEQGMTEAGVQSRVRLEASRKGLKLWRNNVGALLDERGVPVRYGLANDTPALNKTVKSGDLIGWRPVRITPEHVGSTLAQFVSRECKRPSWSYSGTDHEKAQLRWIEAVSADGGDAKFCNSEGTL